MQEHDDERERGLTWRDAAGFLESLRAAARAAGVRPTREPRPIPKQRACATCAHWQPCQGSETGGQCVKGKYRDCRPLTGAYLFWSPRPGP